MYSIKLHMRVRRARTSCEASFTIFALSFGDSVVNHLARRWKGGQTGRSSELAPALTTLPCRDSKIMKLSCQWDSRVNYWEAKLHTEWPCLLAVVVLIERWSREEFGVRNLLKRRFVARCRLRQTPSPHQPASSSFFCNQKRTRLLR